MERIAERLDRELVWHDMEFSSLIPALQAGKVEVIIGGVEPTPERARQVDFSTIYLASRSAVVHPKAVRWADCLEGHRCVLGSQLGSAFEERAKALQVEHPALELRALGKTSQLVQELQIGAIQGVVVDRANAVEMVQAHPDTLTWAELADDPQDVLSEARGTAIALVKGSPLLPFINQVIAAANADGTLAAIEQRWFGGASPRSSSWWSTVRYIAEGAGLTLQYGIVSVMLGLCLAVPLALAKTGDRRVLRWLAIAYTSVFRGTPLLVQLSLSYYVLPVLTGWSMSAYTAGILTFSLNSAAYVSEVIAGGIRAVDAGHWEAGYALSLSRWQVLRWIILPQALWSVRPALVNEMINMLKESSLISIMGEMEMMRRAQILSAQHYDYLGPLLAVACCYYVMIVALSGVVTLLERRRDRR
jgi:polar amino acid transport system substrate-binding protein